MPTTNLTYNVSMQLRVVKICVSTSHSRVSSGPPQSREGWSINSEVLNTVLVAKTSERYK